MVAQRSDANSERNIELTPIYLFSPEWRRRDVMSLDTGDFSSACQARHLVKQPDSFLIGGWVVSKFAKPLSLSSNRRRSGSLKNSGAVPRVALFTGTAASRIFSRAGPSRAGCACTELRWHRRDTLFGATSPSPIAEQQAATPRPVTKWNKQRRIRIYRRGGRRATKSAALPPVRQEAIPPTRDAYQVMSRIS